ANLSLITAPATAKLPAVWLQGRTRNGILSNGRWLLVPFGKGAPLGGEKRHDGQLLDGQSISHAAHPLWIHIRPFRGYAKAAGLYARYPEGDRQPRCIGKLRSATGMASDASRLSPDR